MPHGDRLPFVPGSHACTCALCTCTHTFYTHLGRGGIILMSHRNPHTESSIYGYWIRDIFLTIQPIIHAVFLPSRYIFSHSICLIREEPARSRQSPSSLGMMQLYLSVYWQVPAGLLPHHVPWLSAIMYLGSVPNEAAWVLGSSEEVSSYSATLQCRQTGNIWYGARVWEGGIVASQIRLVQV